MKLSWNLSTQVEGYDATEDELDPVGQSPLEALGEARDKWAESVGGEIHEGVTEQQNFAIMAVDGALQEMPGMFRRAQVNLSGHFHTEGSAANTLVIAITEIPDGS